MTNPRLGWLALALASLLSQSPARTPSAPRADAPAARYRVKLLMEEKLWDVSMALTLPKPAPFELWIPRWTPGAYHVADFANNVKELSATDAAGHTLKVKKQSPVVSWEIDPGNATEIEIRYQATPTSEGPLAPILELEGSRIAAGRAYLTPCSLLAFVPELQSRPVEVTLELPPGWKTATALDRRDDGTFTAPSYLRLEDSPFLMGRKLVVETFEAAGATHEVAALGKSEDELKPIAEDCKKIVEASSRMMGGLPYKRYVFLFGFGSGGSGGLEHSYSTLILLPNAMPETELLHVIAHEFFHLWNAERIHVEGIEHPDLTKPFTTGTIWLNEGGTEYVSGLILVAAGLQTEKQFFKTLARNYAMVTSPGMREMLTKRSWLEVSKAFTNASMNDFMELVLTHYQEGSVVLFALDLEMRKASGGERGIPDLLRYLFENYAKKGRGYGESELPSILSKIAGADMSGFYDKYIAGPEQVDLSKFVGVIGLKLETSENAYDAKLVEVEKPSPEQLAMRKKLFAIGK